MTHELQLCDPTSVNHLLSLAELRLRRPQGILEAIVKERLRQETLKKNGKFRHTMADSGVTELYKFAVLSEEVGEVARELNETSEFGAGAPNDDSALAAELVQVAAVCVAWLESIANRNGGKLP